MSLLTKTSERYGSGSGGLDQAAVDARVKLQVDAIDGDVERTDIVFDPTTFDESTDLPAANKGEYMPADLAGTITLDGFSYDIRETDRLRCTVDNTPANTPANWQVKRVSPTVGNYIHTFVAADFVPPTDTGGAAGTPTGPVDGRLYLPIVPAATHGKGVTPLLGEPIADSTTPRSIDADNRFDDGYQVQIEDNADLIFSVVDGKAFNGTQVIG